MKSKSVSLWFTFIIGVMASISPAVASRDRALCESMMVSDESLKEELRRFKAKSSDQEFDLSQTTTSQDRSDDLLGAIVTVASFNNRLARVVATPDREESGDVDEMPTIHMTLTDEELEGLFVEDTKIDAGEGRLWIAVKAESVPLTWHLLRRGADIAPEHRKLPAGTRYTESGIEYIVGKKLAGNRIHFAAASTALKDIQATVTSRAEGATLWNPRLKTNALFDATMGTWTRAEKVPLIDLARQRPILPNADDFKILYPTHLIEISGRPFLIDRYDPSSGQVTVSRHEHIRGSEDERDESHSIVIDPFNGKHFAIIGTFADAKGALLWVGARREEIILPWESFNFQARHTDRATFPFPALSLQSATLTNSKPQKRLVPFVNKASIEYRGFTQEPVVFHSVNNSGSPKTKDCEVHRFNITLSDATCVEIKAAIPVSIPALMRAQALTQARQMIQSLPQGFEDAVSWLLLDDETHKRVLADASETGEAETGIHRVIRFLLNGRETTSTDRIETFWHELGHQIANKLWRGQIPFLEWSRAMDLDGAFFSAYAMTSDSEDFAETIRAYLKSDAGHLDLNLRWEMPHRFALLDRIFGINMDQAIASGLIHQHLRRSRHF